MKLTFIAVAIMAGLVGCASDATDPDTDNTEQAARRRGGNDTRPGSHTACNLDSQCGAGEECRRGICQIDDNAATTSSSSSGGASSSGAAAGGASSSSGGASSSSGAAAGGASSSSGGASSSSGATPSGGGSGTRPGSHTACTFDSQCLSNEECRRGICQVNF